MSPQPKKPAEGEEPVVTAEDTAEPMLEEPAAEDPKPKRTRRKAAAKAKAEPAAEGEPAEDEATEAEAPVAAAVAEAPAEKPKRAPRKRGAAATEEKPAPATKPVRPAGERPVVRAQARYVRSSARKARLVCDHIRGKTVVEARSILEFSPRAVARDWSKLLESAVANAEHNHELVGDELRVVQAYADEGPTLKRFRPRAMGRATRIRKRTSHLTILLTPED
jgi:ribosomal protein L22